MTEHRCCAYAFGAKAISDLPDWTPKTPGDFTAISDPHTRAILTRLDEIANFWLRSPTTWQALGTYLRSLNRDITIWVGGSWTGREGFSAALTCAHAGITNWHVEVCDTNTVYINESAGPRGGRFKTHEIIHDTPTWAHQYFDTDGTPSRLCQKLRDRVSFTVSDFTRDEPPRCDVAIVSDVWRRPTAAQRREQERFPHRDLPVLNLAQRRALAARIHDRLQPDGVLMLAPLDVCDLNGIDWLSLMHGRSSGAAHYDPPTPVAELFEPLHPDGHLFPLLWRPKRDAVG